MPEPITTLEELLKPLRDDPSRSAVLLDVDGVLAPIVAHPDDAHMPETTRRPLIDVAKRYGVVACVSGRRASDARRIVSLLRDTDLNAAIYVGDDMTDLDAFRGLTELVEKGRLGTAIRIGVRSDEGPAKLSEEADWMVEGTDGVRELLRALLD